ncbi:3-dehydroquinate synthase II [Heliophilum fasciatum]|uniref:3-dehydroquinate synthase II n=1 Tax=Heliophilum fasciatum TaxID=35700 RepID=A0A4R2RZ05_9FIRM|nr:3-dehydroquinate synthase II [Heliophilum fasciatum]MCW2276756.1 3-dehydroquinate synthase II/3-amino-4-hydroxybenzoic acid synthase [Heliophilum fasciatum]TCP68863.1 3-dehydroquinate synthase II [Heliophilum fasciatum]
MSSTQKSTREFWFDGRTLPLDDHATWSLVHNSPIDRIVLTTAQRQEMHLPRKTVPITAITAIDDLEVIPEGEIVLSAEPSLLDMAAQRGYRTCLSLFVQGGQGELADAWQNAARYDYAIVDFDLPTNIPLELIIARLQERKTVLLKKETTVMGVEIAYGVMEKGSDGVLFASTDLQEISQAGQYLATVRQESIELVPLCVEAVRHIGMGLRACVDTTGIMTTDEGMLIGSTSNGGIFVCSETHYLPYMNLRPFRVNAGAVHSYVWMPGDAAEYLTDLKAGSQVLCVNTQGQVRTLTVGRVKIEVRPLLLIQGTARNSAGIDIPINVIVQDDWHIRIMGADGKPLNATTIQPGTELLSYISIPGRHVGIKVDETILER